MKAQYCIDTVHIRGYYVIKKKANEIQPKLIKEKGSTTLQIPIDIHHDPSFIPCDSINKNRPLSYWLNHFFDDTKQVFISCEKFSVEYFVSKDCLVKGKKNNDTCNFPKLASKTLYQTTNLNTGDVFEIYYLDAYWAKVKIKKDGQEVDMIPSIIAQRSISPSIDEFDLLCFIKADKVDINPKIKDPHIRIWKSQ
jgi:hypothetical protein